jgi:RNA polymerase sigma-70 factor (ECF subfamily)
MGRHAADRSAPGSHDPEIRDRFAGGRRPRHADLFAPSAGSRAARVSAERMTQAFERLIEPHREGLRAYILQVTQGDKALADSVLTETLYRIAREPRRYPQSPAAVRPWLVLSALSVLHDGERHAPAGHDDRPPAPDRPAPEPAAADLAAAVPATTIVAAMAELPSQQRELIIELFYRGESLESAAAARDVPVGTLKSRLYYAMRALRAVLDQHVDRHDIR